MTVPKQRLPGILDRIDGRGYKAYQELRGSYAFDTFTLHVDRVQADPFAAPSRMRVRVDPGRAAFPSELVDRPIRRLALGDYLTRCFSRQARKRARRGRGTGRSGEISIDSPGQTVLERSSVLIGDEVLEVRFVMGLPAAGRRVLGRHAQVMLLEELPSIIARSLFFDRLDSQLVRRHVFVVEDQDSLRRQLASQGLVAFVGNGSILPRRSGVDDRPLGEDGPIPLVPFRSPPSLQIELERPHGGPIRGMGLPRGLTLIVGGGFHGKSTLLRALEQSVYDHIPDDGRHLAVTIDSAAKVRSEDGRSIEGVDISPFINNLPLTGSTKRFSTENASGSTSQAANIMEALEVGSQLLLIDEDTSATNFMIRDARMQKLVAKEKEPITPFVDKVGPLFREHGVSTILVMGGCGDYFEHADQVLLLEEYRVRDVSEAAASLAIAHPTARVEEGDASFGDLPSRRVRAESFDPSKGRRRVRIVSRGLDEILFGTTPIDVSALEQLVDPSQTRAIAAAIFLYSQEFADSSAGLRQGLSRLLMELKEQGLDRLQPGSPGDLAMPRIVELAGAINRMRSLQVDDTKSRSNPKPLLE